MIEFRTCEIDTSSLKKPYDAEFGTVFVNLATRLLTIYGGLYCYTQGTRIAIITTKGLSPNALARIGSTVTAVFNSLREKMFVVFDAKLTTLKSIEEGIHTLRKMKKQSIRKTVAIVCERHYSCDETRKWKHETRLAKIREKGDDWEKYDETFRVGMVLVREYSAEKKGYHIYNKQDLI